MIEHFKKLSHVTTLVFEIGYTKHRERCAVALYKQLTRTDQKKVRIETSVKGTPNRASYSRKHNGKCGRIGTVHKNTLDQDIWLVWD